MMAPFVVVVLSISSMSSELSVSDFGEVDKGAVAVNGDCRAKPPNPAVTNASVKRVHFSLSPVWIFDS